MRTTRRRMRAIVAVLAAALAVVTVIGPVAAASPQKVTIVSHVTFNPDGPNFGEFEASGKAVDRGRICPNGTFEDTFLDFPERQPSNGLVRLNVGKDFTCADGSGTFSVFMAILADFDTGDETFLWAITGGSGDYTSLKGGGVGSTVALPGDPRPGNINTYRGLVLH